jgi:putative RecB family exonuclease
MANSKLITLAQLKEEQLHISYSQIFTYVHCPLKYRFRYVEARPPERISVALPFGTAIHAALELFYRTYMDKQEITDVKMLEKLFADTFTTALLKSEVPVIHKNDETKDGLIETGKAMLRAFSKSINLKNKEVIGVETALSGRLYTSEGQPTDFNVIGVIDALIKEKVGTIIATDHKTAARAKQQADVDEDLQFSTDAYLLASNRIVAKANDVRCQMDVLRKLKRPKMEHYHTVRTPVHRRRFAKIACQVLNAIDKQVFYPVRSWMCSDCGYRDACRDW